jgi:hypothetical protein
MKSIQFDVKSTPYTYIQSIFKNMKPFDNSFYENYRVRISNWDGLFNLNSDLSTLYESFIINLGTIAGSDVIINI